MCWTHPDKKRRVFLLQRSDGGCNRLVEEFSDDEFEMCWIQVDRGGSFYDSEETAVREIHGDFPWTTEVSAERQSAEPDSAGNH